MDEDSKLENQVRGLLADVKQRKADAETGMKHSRQTSNHKNAEYYRGRIDAYVVVEDQLEKILPEYTLEAYVDSLLDLSQDYTKLANEAYECGDDSRGAAHAEVARAYAIAAEGLESRLRGENTT